MTTDEMQPLLLEHRMVAVLRLPNADQALAAARAVIAGGARIIEVTLTVPGALGLIRELVGTVPADVVIGAGTVLSVDDLDRALAAGARFAVSPDVFPELIQAAAARHIFHVPGAMTPTEVTTALRAGSRVVKLFPIASLGGAAHVRLVRAPLPAVPFLVTGGVDLPEVDEFFAAGASAVGLTTTLIPTDAAAAGDWKRVSDLATAWVERIAKIPRR